MRYEQVIEGAPRKSAENTKENRFKRVASAPRAVTRRFPPVLQVLTRTAPYVEQQLSAFATQSFQQGKTVAKICQDLTTYSRSLGYDATIGVQEVYSSDLPSFKDQTVMTALLMIDLRAFNAESALYQRAV